MLALAAIAELLAVSGCATTRVGRPHEDQLSKWYHRIQVEEARIEVATSTLGRPIAEAQRQEAMFAINDATVRICDAATLIGETDAELRCQMARRSNTLNSQDP